MAKNNRVGKRKNRRQIEAVEPKLGHYSIVTDTDETEKNYFYGLRDSLPKEQQRNIVIKVSPKVLTHKLVKKCLEINSYNPSYSEPWIIFDRDEVKDFDKIIDDAERNGINVGWSNPCFEVWLSAYFGNIPYTDTSVKCCNEFSNIYKKNANIDYKKSNENLYKNLIKFGDEHKAIERSKNKRKNFERDGIKKPSDMFPCTTVDVLVEEIRNKIEEE